MRRAAYLNPLYNWTRSSTPLDDKHDAYASTSAEFYPSSQYTASGRTLTLTNRDSCEVDQRIAILHLYDFLPHPRRRQGTGHSNAPMLLTLLNSS